MLLVKKKMTPSCCCQVISEVRLVCSSVLEQCPTSNSSTASPSLSTQSTSNASTNLDGLADDNVDEHLRGICTINQGI